MSVHTLNIQNWCSAKDFNDWPLLSSYYPKEAPVANDNTTDNKTKHHVSVISAYFRSLRHKEGDILALGVLDVFLAELDKELS
jgi:hypothetical protein